MMADENKIDVNDINYAIYKLGNWKNNYEIRHFVYVSAHSCGGLQ